MGMMLTRSADRQLRHESCPACLQKLPQFLQALVELLLAAGVYPRDQAPQHVLINSYSKAAGISPHMDGPLYSPCVATITLGGPALMAFHEVQPDGTQGQLATEVFTTILATACFFYMYTSSGVIDVVSAMTTPVHSKAEAQASTCCVPMRLLAVSWMKGVYGVT